MKKSLEIARKAGRSLQRAVDRVVKEHEKTGEPLVIYKTGRTTSEDPHQALAVHETPVQYKTRKKKA